VTDIFFSYSSVDRERVRPIRDTLVAQGFEVFWDQQVPPGMDWDTWIRQHLTKSKCAMAFWSATSVSSDNVRHEAMVAKQQGKLISVLLEPLTIDQFPMGLYAQQAANLSGWNGDFGHDEWRKFRREFEAKLTPLWVRRQIDEIEAELVGERARREGAERRDKVLKAQIAKEAEIQQDLKQERDKALDEVAALNATVEKLTRAGAEAATREVEAERRDRALQAQIAKEAEAFQDLKRERDKTIDEVMALKATVGELTQARADAKAKLAEAQQALKRERDSALDEAAALKAAVEEATRAREHAEATAVELSQRLRKVRQSKAQEIARSIGAALSPLVIAAAVATAGFWTYQLIWSSPQSLSAGTSESAQETEQKTADLEAKLKTAEAEQQRLEEEVQRHAEAAAGADGKRKAAEAEQQRLKDETQRQTKAAVDADARRKAAEAEQQRQAKAAADAETKLKAAEAEQGRLKEQVQLQVKAATDADARRKSAEADQERLKAEVQRLKAASPASPASVPSLAGGYREPAASSTGLFTIKPNTEAIGRPGAMGDYLRSISSTAACEESCARGAFCKVFAYDISTGVCYRYSDSRADFAPNEKFDSGIRK
jgi:hypothetical protein